MTRCRPSLASFSETIRSDLIGVLATVLHRVMAEGRSVPREVAFDAGKSLLRHEAPEESVTGIVIAVASLVVMRLLARAGRRGRGAAQKCAAPRGLEADRALHLALGDSPRRA